jgi:hypothetical protein
MKNWQSRLAKHLKIFIVIEFYNNTIRESKYLKGFGTLDTKNQEI